MTSWCVTENFRRPPGRARQAAVGGAPRHHFSVENAFGELAEDILVRHFVIDERAHVSHTACAASVLRARPRLSLSRLRRGGSGRVPPTKAPLTKDPTAFLGGYLFRPDRRDQAPVREDDEKIVPDFVFEWDLEDLDKFMASPRPWHRGGQGGVLILE